MQITVDIRKEIGLFLKQEMGEGTIADESVRFGICLPGGSPYVHVRGEYYIAPNIFEVMLRAIHEEEEADASAG